MMINHTPPDNLLYPLETKIVIISLFERENHMDEIFARAGDIGNSLIGIDDGYHCFVRMNGNGADVLKFGYKMIEKH